MRRVTALLAALTAVVVMAVVALVIAADDDAAPLSDGLGLTSQKAAAGDIDIVVTPQQLDDRGAAFTVTLDTHTGALDADLTQSTLAVGGSPWPGAAWDGDGPGGHHRTGRLSFGTGGRPNGAVVLTISGLPEPVRMTWTLDDTAVEP